MTTKQGTYSIGLLACIALSGAAFLYMMTREGPRDERKDTASTSVDDKGRASPCPQAAPSASVSKPVDRDPDVETPRISISLDSAEPKELLDLVERCRAIRSAGEKIPAQLRADLPACAKLAGYGVNPLLKKIGAPGNMQRCQSICRETGGTWKPNQTSRCEPPKGKTLVAPCAVKQ